MYACSHSEGEEKNGNSAKALPAMPKSVGWCCLSVKLSNWHFVCHQAAGSHLIKWRITCTCPWSIFLSDCKLGHPRFYRSDLPSWIPESQQLPLTITQLHFRLCSLLTKFWPMFFVFWQHLQVIYIFQRNKVAILLMVVGWRRRHGCQYSSLREQIFVWSL